MSSAFFVFAGSVTPIPKAIGKGACPTKSLSWCSIVQFLRSALDDFLVNFLFIIVKHGLYCLHYY